jgi:sugar (pentulose or hexulose) kinase
MMGAGWTIVLDIGKTQSKASLWEEAGSCVAYRERPNCRPTEGERITLDIHGIEAWLAAVLREYASLGPVSGLIPVAHGAGIALIRDGALQCSPLDYEWIGVERARAPYEPQRDAFADSGSPALPAGLNIGLQLHWLESLDNGPYADAQLLPWAQYWAWKLCGEAAAEVTSLGCHSDLWRPFERAPSALARRRGWADRLAPLKAAGTVLGTLTRDWVKRTGLSARTRIYCGLHDSNAALVAARHQSRMIGRDVTVLSTGTWFVAMRSPQSPSDTPAPRLPDTRDCLVNVDIDGAPVPSARFMGGREIQVLTGADTDPAAETSGNRVTLAGREDKQRRYAMQTILAGDMILPSAVRGVGPFPNAPNAVLGPAADLDHAIAKAHLYAALVADASLDLIGSRDTLFIDGRFARSPVFTGALAALRPRTALWISEEPHGVAQGALRVVDPSRGPCAEPQPVAPLDGEVADYRDRWRSAAERAG